MYYLNETVYMQNCLQLQSHCGIPTRAQYFQSECVTCSYLVVGGPWYISDTDVSQELCERDIRELLRKEHDYVIHMTSLNIPKDVVFTQYKQPTEEDRVYALFSGIFTNWFIYN